MSNTQYNTEQQQAIQHTGSPLLVIAGAGTGKTTMLVGRIAHLLNQGVPPENIIMMTFTNKAAKSMIERASKENPNASRILAGTFHSVALRLLVEFGFSEGFYQNQKVLGDYQMQRMWEKAYQATFNSEERNRIKQMKLGGLPKLKFWYSKTRTGMMDLPTILETYPESENWEAFRQGAIAELFRAYNHLKYDYKAYDFDDILFKFHQMLQRKSMRNRIQDTFTHFFVDEYQDTSLLQAEILRTLAAKTPNITAVGDPNQSIYSFLSANIQNILQFQKDFPHTKVIKLNQNYRSSQIILDVANTILVNNTEAIYNPLVSGKTFRSPLKPHVHKYGSDRTEAMGIMRDIKNAIRKGTPLDQIAILSRQSSSTYTLESELTKEGLKYVKYGGLKLTAKQNIRQFLALVELALDRFNWLAWEIILPMCPLIGDKLTEEIVGNLSYQDNWEWDRPPPFSIGSGKRWKALQGFWEQLKPLGGIEAGTPEAFLDAVFDTFQPIYHNYWANAPAKEKEAAMSEDLVDAEYFSNAKDEDQEEIDLFNQDLKQTPAEGESESYASLKLKEVKEYVLQMSLTRQEDLRQFLNQFSLDDSLETKQDEPAIVVSTIHSAKGLEWDIVFVLGLEEGTLPPKPRKYGKQDTEELRDAYPGILPFTEFPYTEEERRLFYVAATRAACELHLCYASMRRGEGMKDSRFIKHLLPRPILGGSQELDTHFFTYEKMRSEEENARFRKKNTRKEKKHLPNP